MTAFRPNAEIAPRRRRGLQLAWRVLGYALLGAVLAVAFLGYLRPQMVVGWDALMAWCGF
ncbi:MAG: hypothetical protein QHC78_02140 [Pigmentiphaga sp.]|uniref:hypothetical protein n=1 Tax=Pigmentiphaga sp. TaxID=1977564 RepID=UPI0029A4AD3E|nr:hypothetical protein [Pigmentiphaga sp.]MDX3904477.1 hypothetical protein [Pigmentiphaga sp.]